MLTKNDANWLCIHHKKHSKKIEGCYTSDVKLSVKALYQTGLGSTEISRLLGVPPNQILKWTTGDRKRIKKKFYYKTPEARQARNSDECKEWRKSVFERDKWTCQQCGKVGGGLHAHHILSFAKYPVARFDLNNGVTLCKKCHRKLHKKAIAA